MKNMTWKEFKELIDKELAEKGLPQDVEIWYIDFSFPDASHESTTPSVGYDPQIGIIIS